MFSTFGNSAIQDCRSDAAAGAATGVAVVEVAEVVEVASPPLRALRRGLGAAFFLPPDLLYTIILASVVSLRSTFWKALRLVLRATTFVLPPMASENMEFILVNSDPETMLETAEDDWDPPFFLAGAFFLGFFPPTVSLNIESSLGNAAGATRPTTAADDCEPPLLLILYLVKTKSAS